MKLLERYIKRIVAEQQRNSNNNILQMIVKKLSAKYAFATEEPGTIPSPIVNALDVISTRTKQNAFWKTYSTDSSFRKSIYSTYVYNKDIHCFDFLIITPELKPYLRQQFANAEMLLIESNKVSSVKIEDVRNALEIAENVEEFREMVRASL